MLQPTARRMTADEKRWQAESDASTLRRMAELQNSPARQKAAEAQLKRELAEQKKALQVMEKAITKTTKPTQKKGGRK